ncbi:MAG TPA: NifU family protein [Candidatus Micrarchaeia archaeon]|nr:NifU family protein [Candidatus Micrarchaeia archaeon]
MVDNSGPDGLPRIETSPLAARRIGEVRQRSRRSDARVRITLAGRTEGRLSFAFDLADPGEEHPDELQVAGPDGVVYLVPERLRRQLDGARIDADALSGALRAETRAPATASQLAQAVQALLDEEINPAVAMHGGFIELIDVADGVAIVEMGGGCQGCGMAEVTLSQGVRTAIQGRFPEITDVVDVTDHAEGANPYYQAAKK